MNNVIVRYTLGLLYLAAPMVAVWILGTVAWFMAVVFLWVISHLEVGG